MRRAALYEAATNPSRHTSPDNSYHQADKKTHDGKLAAISVAHKACPVRQTQVGSQPKPGGYERSSSAESSIPQTIQAMIASTSPTTTAAGTSRR